MYKPTRSLGNKNATKPHRHSFVPPDARLRGWKTGAARTLLWGSWRAIEAVCLCAMGVYLAMWSASGRVLASDDVPAWLRQAAAVSLPAYDKKVPAVVL